jgi:uncharacterized protein (TIGR02145 family)
MKRLYSLFLIAVLFGCTLRAQVITITFEGTLNGASIPLDSILVMNWTSGGDTTIYFPDNVLVLGSTSLNEIGGQGPVLRNQPNPFAGATDILVSTRNSGQALLTVYDATGREVAAYDGSLAVGQHRFRFTATTPGVHVLTVSQGAERATHRLVATAGEPSATGLTYAGGTRIDGTAKSDRVLFTWTPGDALRYIGYATDAGIVHSAAIDEVPVATATRTFELFAGLACPEAPTVTDIDGNVYRTVQIGGQCWTAENLRTTTYANGDPIPNVTDSTAWTELTTGAWVHYDNNASYENPYGKLYNWYAVADPRNVCPTGWHVSTHAEWITVVDFLHPNNLSNTEENNYYSITASRKLKSADGQYWQEPPPPMCATNESGFSALPGGGAYDGSFGVLGYYGNWWSASESGAENAWSRYISNGGLGSISGYGASKRAGFSVRCLRD